MHYGTSWPPDASANPFRQAPPPAAGWSPARNPCSNRRSEEAGGSWRGRPLPLQISLPYLHPDAVQGILEYHYVGKVCVRGLESLLALAFAVQELGVHHMKDLISRKIVESVNAETCVAIIQRSPQEWREPFHVAWRFALSQVDQVARSSSFLKLDKSRLEELLR